VLSLVAVRHLEPSLEAAGRPSQAAPRWLGQVGKSAPGDRRSRPAAVRRGWSRANERLASRDSTPRSAESAGLPHGLYLSMRSRPGGSAENEAMLRPFAAPDEAVALSHFPRRPRTLAPGSGHRRKVAPLLESDSRPRALED
jgi:hypothetical protein